MDGCKYALFYEFFAHALVYPRLSFAVWSVRPQHLQKQVCALVDFRYLLLFSRVGFPSSTFLSSRTNNTPPPRSGRHASPKAHFTTKVGTPRVPAHACYNKPNLRTPKRLCKRACLRFLTNEGGCLYEDLRHRGARHHDSQSDNTGALFPIQIG